MEFYNIWGKQAQIPSVFWDIFLDFTAATNGE